MLNGDFEAEGFMDGWIAVRDPGGSIRFEAEKEEIGTGTCALRATLREAGAGGIIQRIVVTPESVMKSAESSNRRIQERP